MASVDSRPTLSSGRSVWGVPVDFRDSVLPLAWLGLGLLLTYLYKHAADYSPMFASGLPQPFFPPQAVILSILLLTPLGRWWLYLLAYYVIHVAEGISVAGLPSWYVLLSNVGNVVEPLVGALLCKRFILLPPRFNRLRDVGIYVACVAAASVVGASWGAMARAIAGFQFWTAWSAWFLADVLASLVLAPTIILWVSVGFNRLRPRERLRQGEAAVLFVGLLLVGSLVFGTHIETADRAPALLYFPVPLLIWAAVRFGPLGFMSSLSLVTVLAIAGVDRGFGPFIDLSTPASIFSLQVFLLGIGVPLFFLAALVHEHQEAQAGLEQSEARYRAVVSNFPHGAVLLFGSDLRHLFADGQGLPEIGLARKSVEGKTVWEAFPAEMASALAPRYQAALAGAHASFELAHAERTYQVQVLPVSFASEAAGMVVLQDVTEQRRAEVLAASEAALRTANEQLEELSRAKTDFLSLVSHEFRNPLGSIGGFSEMLRDDPLDLADRREYSSLINAEAQRLGRLVDDLLDLDRLESGRVELQPEAVDLNAIVATVLEEARPSAPRHMLRADVALGLPALRGDPDKLIQLVANLVSNAIKYSPDGGTVTVGIRADGHQAHLWVRDEGLGVPPDALGTIFERYARVDSAEHRAIKGTGLGLPIVRQIAELHGGRAWAESEPGAGSTFQVTLPLGGPSPAASDAGEPDAQT